MKLDARIIHIKIMKGIILHSSSTRLKAEWEEQIGILMAFPHKNSDWANHIKEARECFLNIIENILCFESVILCVDTDDNEGMKLLCEYFVSHTEIAKTSTVYSYIRTYLNQNVPQHTIANPYLQKMKIDSQYALHIIRIKTNDTWSRDFGGIGIESAGQCKLLKCMFNGWGLKYPANYDNIIISSIFSPHHIIQADIVLEGGSIDGNGDGVLLTNTQCLLAPNRNPHLNQDGIESKLKEYFGLKEVLWLNHGYLAGDDTDSHIDTLARFITADSIAYIACENEDDEHFESLKCMKKELQSLRQKNGKPYKLIPLPFTQAIFDENGDRLPSSYANFLFLNNALLVPTYNDENDLLAIKTLSHALPSHKIIGVDCRSLILWHGSLHCISMQLYADNSLK